MWIPAQAIGAAIPLGSAVPLPNGLYRDLSVPFCHARLYLFYRAAAFGSFGTGDTRRFIFVRRTLSAAPHH